MAVISCVFRKSTMRVIIDRTSPCVLTMSRLVIGSTTTIWGLNAETHLWVISRCCSMPPYVERAAWNSSRPLLTHGWRSMPIDRMFRTICLGDSSNAKYRQRSPRRQAASTKCAATLDLPAPDVPDSRMLLPR